MFEFRMEAARRANHHHALVPPTSTMTHHGYGDGDGSAQVGGRSGPAEAAAKSVPPTRADLFAEPWLSGAEPPQTGANATSNSQGLVNVDAASVTLSRGEGRGDRADSLHQGWATASGGTPPPPEQWEADWGGFGGAFASQPVGDASQIDDRDLFMIVSTDTVILLNTNGGDGVAQLVARWTRDPKT